MPEDRGAVGIGGIFGNNWVILFFILVFLLLFWDGFGFGGFCDPK